MKKLILILLCLCAFALPVSGESYSEFYEFFLPFFHDQSPWDMNRDQVMNYVNRFSFFQCTDLVDGEGLKVTCKSDRKKFDGNYRLVFRFSYAGKFQSVELQIVHPVIDEFVKADYADMSFVASNAFQNMRKRDYFRRDGEPKPVSVSDNSNYVYEKAEATNTYSGYIFNDSAFLVGYIEKAPLIDNTLVLLFSELGNFYNHQRYYTSPKERAEGMPEYIVLDQMP